MQFKTFDPIELKEFVEKNPRLVSRKQSKRYPNLYVLKYDRRVFYDNLWHLNPLLLECRGLVVDADYNVVVKPFTKVFNHGENGTEFDPDEMCTVVRKVNGFMACVTKNTKYSDELIISTTGSLDSDFVTLAEKWILPIKDQILSEIYDQETFIFEICDKSDPHIIEEEEGAYLIGTNYFRFYDNQWASAMEFEIDKIVEKTPDIRRPETVGGRFHKIPFKEVVELSKKVEHEGFMVISAKGTLKIKSPHYLVTKFIARMGDKKYKEVFESGSMNQKMKKFDEEYYPLFKYIATLGEDFKNLDEENRIRMIREFLTRKE